MNKLGLNYSDKKDQIYKINIMQSESDKLMYVQKVK